MRRLVVREDGDYGFQGMRDVDGVVTRLCLVDGVVVCATNRGQVVAIDCSSGDMNILWTADARSVDIIAGMQSSVSFIASSQVSHVV